MHKLFYHRSRKLTSAWLLGLWLLTSLLILIASPSHANTNIEPQAEAPNQAYQALTDFGDNPGELTARYFVPEKYDNRALVVLLHGCVQEGVTLADKSGLTALASSHHFAVLVPQQSYENNVKACFNWFSNQDTQQDSGEMLSIKNMIAKTQEQLQARQVYLIGLSAGGAMASALLINYPDQFEAGAIIAGLTYPCADNLTKAISCMKSGPAETNHELVDYAKRLHPKRQGWPSLIIWTGLKDTVVNPVNSQRLAQYWAELTQAEPLETKTPHQGYQQSLWKNSVNSTDILLVEINNMNHGISVNQDIKNGGTETDFLINSPISTMVETIKKWQL
ncbi:PHB depolymerase family esterase [Shewanella sp. AS1]|uniref:extracellular catalytic domain type 1 short-chain-length polyhydroxyalkanoate depolymerase n=1 Tax=Shewanella sp. AS1 TaxID=2907626 RepID=UPI001F26411E|nr:PHB depolymerase family esterase [Shewanella sp. AS1]MCE9680566.1 PHB depolymerase family esterase [Shewanella sp. AS1]